MRIKTIKTFISLFLILSVVLGQTYQAFGEDIEAQPSEGTTTESEQAIPAETATSTDSEAVSTTTPEAVSTSTPTSTPTTTASTSVSVAGEAVSSSTPVTVGTSTIETGDAIASANVLNVVNVNVFDSDTLVAFLEKASNGDANPVDLRKLDFEQDGYMGCDGCTLSTSTLGTTTLSASTTNAADITNDVSVTANSGNNQVSETGNAIVRTGNAYAVANVINAVNMTLVKSKYLSLVFDNFGMWYGDLVLPTSDFFTNFLTPPNDPGLSAITATSTNTAEIENSTQVNSETGNNEATSTAGQATVITGNSGADTFVTNDVNENHIGGSSVMIVFRIFGKWSGKVFNLPALFTQNNGISSVQFVAEDASKLEDGSLNLNTSNTAKITNRVNVSANSGGNSASAYGDSGIETGDAYSVANIVNTVNTTSVGRNWMNVLVNVFGDWEGNVSFGQPDLWVGTRAEFEDGDSRPGSTIRYSYTVRNNGDAPAHDVVLRHESDSKYIDLENKQVISLGTLEPGQVREISSDVPIYKDMPYGNTAIGSRVGVKADETDANPSDNSDVISMVVENPLTNDPSGPNSHNNDLVWLFVNAHNSASSSVEIGSSVTFYVNVLNKGGYGRDTFLENRIMSPEGEVVFSEDWPLGDIYGREEIDTNYTVSFGASSTPGIYTQSAQVKVRGDHSLDSNIATSSFELTKKAEVSDIPASTFVKRSSSKRVIKPLEEAQPTPAIYMEGDLSSTSTYAVYKNNKVAGGGLLASASGLFSGAPSLFLILLLLLLLLLLTDKKKPKRAYR